MSAEVEKNQEIYDSQLKGELEPRHNGKVALMHDGELVMVFNDEGDAVNVGQHFYGLGNFSIVRVGAKPIRLGAMTPLA